MSLIWNFSPSLQSEVQRCLSAARENKPNKWQKVFGSVHNEIVRGSNLDSVNNDDPCDVIEKENDCVMISDEQERIVVNSKTTLDMEKVVEICEFFGNDLTSRIDALVTECLQNNNLLYELSQRLSLTTVEKFCKLIYNRNIDHEFVSLFFKHFLPAYVKREYNCLTLDLIKKGSETYPLQFKEFLSELIKDVEVPNKVLQDYLALLSDEERRQCIFDISELDMSSEQFMHNLYAIYITYKDCKKTDDLQLCIYTTLMKYSLACSTDRNYGRLFLSYLQALKQIGGKINYANLEKALDSYQSPFKRPCIMLLNELREKIVSNNSVCDSE